MTSSPPPYPGQPAYPTYPGPPTPPPPRISTTAKVLVGVGAACLLLLWGIATVFFLGVLGGLGDRLAGDQDLADLRPQEACERAVTEAVRISAEQEPAVLLEDVTDLVVLRDERDDHELPSGDTDATVLSCRGTGVWSDGDTTTPVLVGVTVDADGVLYVFYEATGPLVTG
ncbi:hypothetical protein [Nocardioides abyssi]|uniref:Uncharacterized protein n=1 Tax=Nocardioides abyssi TaxID=3058370 RepID=A0ABT8EP44_9ACTN|nr:hypothetical protein [Nocardioides abyssi]MDN4159908.1 hypothetical protein [Nocardioides abyssi]